LRLRSLVISFHPLQESKEELEEVGDPRIIENYAVLLAFHSILTDVLNVEYDLKPYLREIATKKSKDCSQRQENYADDFFSYLNVVFRAEVKAIPVTPAI
jgi:hypothetical protein